jgi:HAD superfamily hydrolase (TIGR01509 family)
MPSAVFPATLFDYNGVLVDDEAVHLAAFQAALAPLGIQLSEADYWARYLGFDDVGAFRAILTDAGRPPTDQQVRELVEAKKPLYLERARGSLSAFEGARELVEQRAAAGPVGIVSGALRSEIELGLAVLGVADRVTVIISADDTTESKPSPQGYRMGQAALAQLAGEDVAREALVVEDSIAGIQAARAAGLACVAITHSYPAAELAAADLVVERLQDITEAALAELYGARHAR